MTDLELHNTGFTVGLEGKQYLIFKKLADEVKSMKKAHICEGINIIILPVVRRICGLLFEKYNPMLEPPLALTEKINVKDIITKLENFQWLIEGAVSQLNSIDAEAEMIELFCKNYATEIMVSASLH